ncbi:MAG: phage holin family protein [Firmicutes bacterium]|nr:phage holin family protein [Bacillota bacterium]
MRLIIKEKNKVRINRAFEWLLYMVGYIIVFVFVTSFFKSIYIDENNLIIYSTLIVLIIYLLNKTVKPILVTLTIPITGITLGLFYPCINLFILKIVDLLLGKHFQLHNIYIALLVAILLSIMNLIMEGIINKILKKVKRHG